MNERSYNVLLVSAAPKFSGQLRSLLDEARCFVTEQERSASGARRRLSERQYDIILITSPLPDENGLGFAIEQCTGTSSAVALFVGADDYETISAEAVPHGVYVLARPIPRQLVTQGFDWLRSTRERLRRLEHKTVSLQEKMGEIRTVNRAKWVLISDRGMTEEEAHRYIEKYAMDSGLTRLTVAQMIINGGAE